MKKQVLKLSWRFGLDEGKFVGDKGTVTLGGFGWLQPREQKAEASRLQQDWRNNCGA
jgi:hypothetical protein